METLLPETVADKYKFLFIILGKELMGERRRKMDQEFDKRKNLRHLFYPKTMRALTYQCR